MCNFGEVICVKVNVFVLRWIEFMLGCIGFDVKGNLFDFKSGEWVEFCYGKGIVQLGSDQNIFVFIIVGMFKY